MRNTLSTKAKRTCLNNGDRILNGRYEILKCIHSRGMANVYLVRDENLGKQWCLKEIRKSESGTKNIEYISLLQEANILKTLNHERIPRITTIDNEGDSLFVVMDYLEGKTLKDFVSENGKVPEDMAVKWMIQVVQTMAYLHSEKGNKKPIFYRDMKPDNLMVRSNGVINIFDFGISIRVESKNQLPDYTLGTPGYVAPEQKKRDLPVDLRSDIYSMGMTFYYMLTGVDPRSRINKELEPISELSPEVSPSLVNVISKCIKENPDDRYQDCEELQYDLENYSFSDTKYRSMIKRRVATVSILAGVGVSLLIGSIVPFHLNSLQTEDAYNKALTIAQQSGKLEDYSNAISMNPYNLPPYIEFIDTIKSDGVFSLEDETLLLDNINPILSDIKDDSEYGELAFEIGKLYWFYYEDELDLGETVSIKWFEDAINCDYNVDEATVYYNLGVFKRDISKSIKEASDSGMYKEYWGNLLAIQNSNTSDIITIQINISIAECISVYAYNLKKDGVSYDEICTEIEILERFLDDYSVNDSTLDVIESLYFELQDTVDGLSNKVSTVYNISSGGDT